MPASPTSCARTSTRKTTRSPAFKPPLPPCLAAASGSGWSRSKRVEAACAPRPAASASRPPTASPAAARPHSAGRAHSRDRKPAQSSSSSRPARRAVSAPRTSAPMHEQSLVHGTRANGTRANGARPHRGTLGLERLSWLQTASTTATAPTLGTAQRRPLQRNGNASHRNGTQSSRDSRKSLGAAWGQAQWPRHQRRSTERQSRQPTAAATELATQPGARTTQWKCSGTDARPARQPQAGARPPEQRPATASAMASPRGRSRGRRSADESGRKPSCRSGSERGRSSSPLMGRPARAKAPLPAIWPGILAC